MTLSLFFQLLCRDSENCRRESKHALIREHDTTQIETKTMSDFSFSCFSALQLMSCYPSSFLNTKGINFINQETEWCLKDWIKYLKVWIHCQIVSGGINICLVVIYFPYQHRYLFLVFENRISELEEVSSVLQSLNITKKCLKCPTTKSYCYMKLKFTKQHTTNPHLVLFVVSRVRLQAEPTTGGTEMGTTY